MLGIIAKCTFNMPQARKIIAFPRTNQQKIAMNQEKMAEGKHHVSTNGD
jgi:hypothetical protein